ncbi:MAG: hypothetical protein FWD97_08345 [Defluviitaleaceae bacterium]|nr:hypothetical protein [Defluviitaleaceae bacterium]
MSDIFVWNEQSAEQVRQQSEAAMQGQSSDMRETAAAFLTQAANLMAQAETLMAQASAMLATLPIMKTITNSFTNCDGETEYYSKEVEDTAASSAIQSQATAMMAEANRMREAAALLRNSANSLNFAADVLDGKIASTNALFRQMLEYAQATDNRYAYRIQAIKDRIGTYIYRMEALRDSFDLYTGTIDMDVLARMPPDTHRFFADELSTPDARIALSAAAIRAGVRTLEANSSVFTELEWADFAAVLSRRIGTVQGIHLTDADFANLATHFGRAGKYVGDLERFLNLMMVPIPDVSFGNVFRSEPGASWRFPQGGELVAFRMCPDRSSRLSFHLNHQITSKLTTQIDWREAGFRHDSLDYSRRNMQRNYELLSSLMRLYDQNHVFIGVGDDSSLRVRNVGSDGRISASFHYGWMPSNSIHVFTSALGIVRTRTITLSPPRETLATDLQRIAGNNFRLEHQLGMLSDTASFGLGLIPVYGPFFSTSSFVMGTLNRRTSGQNATGNMSNGELTIAYWSLSEYHRDLALEGIVITDSTSGVLGANRDTRIQSWPTARTPESLRALDAFVDMDISWDEFLQNPTIGLDAYIGLSGTQRDELWTMVRNNWEAAGSQVSPPVQSQTPTQPVQSRPQTTTPLPYTPRRDNKSQEY